MCGLLFEELDSIQGIYTSIMHGCRKCAKSSDIWYFVTERFLTCRITFLSKKKHRMLQKQKNRIISKPQKFSKSPKSELLHKNLNISLKTLWNRIILFLQYSTGLILCSSKRKFDSHHNFVFKKCVFLASFS